jgi:peptidoglycan/xylan/chitin deacetylase (PgdA/CDA1 family)
VIPATVERRARWVLDTVGAHDLGFGDDVPYRAEAWERLDRGQRPEGDDVADAFFHLARVEERDRSPELRDRHGRFRAESSCLDLGDPPLERLRRRLGLVPPRWRGARFAIALTHDVDMPWRWTRRGVRGSAGRLKRHALAGQAAPALREARALTAVPLHKLRRSDPNWRFERILRLESARDVRSTFFLLAGHHHPADGATPESYDRLRPRLVEVLAAGGAEIGLHGSYTSAEHADRLEGEKRLLEELGAPVSGQRFHYLRIDPHTNLPVLERLGFAYDTTLGYAEAPGFRAGIAQPFRPWSFEEERPLDLVEIPLAAMDVTFSAPRYLGLSARAAERRLLDLVAWAAEHGGGFSVIWHSERFDPATSGGWDRLYLRLIDAVRARGGVCMSAGELAGEAAAWLR